MAYLETLELNNTNTSSIDSETQKKIFLAFHPVGSFFMTTATTNPNTAYGGTWSQTNTAGKVLMGTVDASKIATSTGSTNSNHDHIQTLHYGGANMYVTNHEHYGNSVVIVAQQLLYAPSASQILTSGDSYETKVYTSTTSNIQPYQAVYIWERTA